MSIILSTLNARFSHASLGLRYLMANMGELASITQIQEFVIGVRAADIVEKLLAHQPRIIGFGVYIWNVDEITHIVALLKRVAPEVIIESTTPVASDCARSAACTVTGFAPTSSAIREVPVL